MSSSSNDKNSDASVDIKSSSYSLATNSSNNKENVDKPTSESSSTKVPSLSFASTTSNKPKKNKKQKIKNTSGVFLPANAMSLPSSDKKNTNFVTSQITIPYTIPSSEPKNEAAFPIVIHFQELPNGSDSSTGSLDSYAEAVDQLKNVPESTDVDDESFGAFETDLEKSPDTGNQLDDMCDGVHMPQTTFDNAANVISVVGKQEVIEELEVQRNEHDQQIDTEKQEMQASTAQVDMNANELQQRSVKHHFAFFRLKAGLLQAKHSCVLAETISDKIQDEIIHPGQVLAGPMYEHFVYKRVETALTKAESLIENSTFGPYAAFAAVCGLVTGRLALGLAWEAAGKVKQAGHQVLTFFIKQQ